MSIITVALLIAVSCTCQSLDEPVPKYSLAKYFYDDAVIKASRIVSVKSPTELDIPNMKHDYVLLIAAVNDISFKLSRSCLGDLYDEIYYEILDETIPRAWKDPEYYIHDFQRLVNVSKEITAPLVPLIEKYCAPVHFKDNVDCDTVIDLIVKSEPEKYKTAANTLLALADFSKIYLQNPRIFEANRNGMVPFLLNGKDKIKPLIKALSTVKRYLEPIHNLGC